MSRLRLRPGDKKHVLEVQLSGGELKKFEDIEKPKDSGEALKLLMELKVLSEKQLRDQVELAEGAQVFKQSEKRKRPDKREVGDSELEHLVSLIQAGRTLNQAITAAKGKPLPAVYRRVGVGLEVRVFSHEGETLLDTPGIEGDYSREKFESAWEKRAMMWRDVGIPSSLISDWKIRCEESLGRYEDALERYAAGQSQEQIAKELNTNQTTVGDWVRGRKVPLPYKWIVYDLRRREFDIPKEESPEFAYILGAYTSTSKALVKSMRVITQDRDALKHFAYCVEKVFGVKPKIKPSTSTKHTPIFECEFRSVNVLAYMRRLTQENQVVPFEHLLEESERKAYFQAILDFNSGVTHKVLHRRDEIKTYPEIDLTFSYRPQLAHDIQVLAKMQGIYPQYTAEKGGIYRLHITGRTDLEAVKEIGFNADRKNRKLSKELSNIEFIGPDHGPEIYEEAISRYEAGESQRSIGRSLSIDKGTPKRWAEGVNIPDRVKRYRAILEIERQIPDPEVVGYMYRELGAPAFIARKVAGEQDMERLLDTCGFLREHGIEPRDDPGILLYPRDTLEKKYVVVKVEPVTERERVPERPVEEAVPEALGLYQRVLDEYPVLPTETQIELAVKAQAGDKEARDLLVNSTLSLVLSIARRYQGRGLELTDLITEGSIGLMRGIDKYDQTLENPETGKPYKVSTYVSWWIRQSIQRAVIDQGKTVRIPLHAVKDITAMKREFMKMTEENKIKPTDEELAERLGWETKKVASYRQYIERSKIRSLDMAFEEDEEPPLLAGLSYRDVEDVPSQAGGNMLKDIVHKTLDILGIEDRWRDIINMRYGLGEYEGKTHTLDEIGSKYHVTRERIRQIEAQVFKRMTKKRSNPYVKTLLDYIGETGEETTIDEL